MTNPDPTVYIDVAEQIRNAIASAPVLLAGNRQYDLLTHHATHAALHELAGILRERAAEHYRPLGRHDIADALEIEADRLSPDEILRIPRLPREDPA